MKINEQRECSVYIHENVYNCKKYIGWTSKDPQIRWGKNGNHYLVKDSLGKYVHPAMANALNKYRDWDNDWVHIIVEDNLTEEEAKQMETELIALYKTNCYRYNNPCYGYNCTDGGDGATGRMVSDEQRKLISKKAKERLSDPKNNPYYGVGEPVVQLTVDGEFVAEYVSASEAARLNNVWEGSIRRACYDHIGVQYGYLWRFKKDYNPSQQYYPQYKLYKAVVQLTKDGVFVAEYENISKASEATGVWAQSISNCCNGDISSTGDFMWIYKSEYDTQKSYQWVNRTKSCVIQLTLNGEFISEYSSIVDASKSTGIDKTAISHCCRGVSMTSGGFKWMYLDKYEQWLTQQNDYENNKNKKEN